MTRPTTSRGISATTAAIDSASLNVGITTTTCSPPPPGPRSRAPECKLVGEGLGVGGERLVTRVANPPDPPPYPPPQGGGNRRHRYRLHRSPQLAQASGGVFDSSA